MKSASPRQDRQIQPIDKGINFDISSILFLFVCCDLDIRFDHGGDGPKSGQGGLVFGVGVF